MVDPKRSSRGVKGSLHPLTAAALSALPPLGYKAPPTLIGFKTIDPSVIALRIKHYNRAYKTLSVNSWNTYVSFGIQDFVGPDEYYSHKENESIDDGNLRLARYYRNHLENHAKIDGFLMQTIPAVETALAKSHPGFFDMSLNDMDSYLSQFHNPNADTPMEIDSPSSEMTQTETADVSQEIFSLATAALKSSDHPPHLSSPALLSTQNEQVLIPLSVSQPSNKEAAALNATTATAQTADSSSEKKVTNQRDTPLRSTSPSISSTTFKHQSLNVKRPSVIRNVVRIEVRWAPRDFHELRASSKKLHLRLAPILSCFNTEHTWMMEWQTDQMEDSSDIDPSQLSKYLSIRFVPVAKEQCFYFSFRIHGSGSQFSKVAASKVLSIAKRGEHMTFDPSAIPASQGDLIFVGDILLKDASVTHRGQYLKYLRNEVLPPATPAFDIKLRHSNPTGSRITILTIRSGKSSSTEIAEIFSNALCGEGMHPEIFISRLALGANQTSKKDHERIYKVHNDYLADVSHLLFSASTAIDTEVTEFLDSGETILRSPRQWAKSLTFPDGNALEADLENGGSQEGKTVLVVPSASLLLAKLELQRYWTRRNPILSHAVKLYQESTSSHPDIPKAVFTKNIATLLSKTFVKSTTPSSTAGTEDTGSLFSPVSSLTGGVTESTPKDDSSHPKSSIAWRQPLQEALLAKGKAKKNKPTLSSTEINQQKTIAILEAQLLLRSGDNSVASHTSSKAARSKVSRSSSHSGLSAASAHSRMDKYETSLEEIKGLLKLLTLHKNLPREAPAPMAAPVLLHDDPLWEKSNTDTSDLGHGMQGIQLFPATSECHQLAILGTPKKSNPSKRRKATSPSKSPSSNLSLQYTEQPGSSGGESC